MATVASIRPMVAFAEATTREKERNARSTNGTCPVYGCVLLPRDIFYDTLSQRALNQLRAAKEEEEEREYDSVGASTTDSSSEAASLKHQQEVSEQALKELIMSGDEDMATLTLIGYKGGDPNQQINQDRAFVIAPFSFCDEQDKPQKNNEHYEQRLMGVFDGHAHLGERVSEYSVQQVPKLLAHKLNANRDEIANDDVVRKCLEETFEEVDQRAPAYPSGGCTATVVLQLGSQVYIANAGDSVSFLVVHRPTTNETEIIYMTREDKPDLPDERDRVERMGGRVYIPNRAGSTPRVIYYDRSTGSQSGLAMSRSIGDWDAGRVGVIPSPIVDVVDLEEVVKKFSNGKDDDDVHVFAVSASDGMMDFLDSETIASVLAAALFNENSDHPLTACERLISIAAASWQRAKEGRYRDDIALAVSKLRTPPNKKTLTKEEL
jgi:serine/threonine protein phosphatase PrpC